VSELNESEIRKMPFFVTWNTLYRRYIQIHAIQAKFRIHYAETLYYNQSALFVLFPLKVDKLPFYNILLCRVSTRLQFRFVFKYAIKSL
jgi:hypothetical protein